MNFPDLNSQIKLPKAFFYLFVPPVAALCFILCSYLFGGCDPSVLIFMGFIEPLFFVYIPILQMIYKRRYIDTTQQNIPFFRLYSFVQIFTALLFIGIAYSGDASLFSSYYQYVRLLFWLGVTQFITGAYYLLITSDNR